MNKWKYALLYVKNVLERALGVEECKLASYQEHLEMQEYFEDKYVEFSVYSSDELRRLQRESDSEVDIIIMEIVLTDRIEEVDSSVLIG